MEQDELFVDGMPEVKAKKGPRRTKTPRTPKPKAPVELSIPDAVPGINKWLIFGLDPSLSRTGYSLMLVERDGDGTKARWLEVGSLKPEDTSDLSWVRAKAVSLALRLVLNVAIQKHELQRDTEHTGLIISFEAAPPRNDHLATVNRILNVTFFEPGSEVHLFADVRVQLTNASTLRSLMGLTQRGSQNKKENVAKAYTYLDKNVFGNLDTDACDAALMAMMGRYSAAILLGCPQNVPERFLTAMCNATVEVVGKGRNSHTRVKGILHRPEYWSRYQRKEVVVGHRDARIKKAKLDRFVFSICSMIRSKPRECSFDNRDSASAMGISPGRRYGTRQIARKQYREYRKWTSNNRELLDCRLPADHAKRLALPQRGLRAERAQGERQQ